MTLGFSDGAYGAFAFLIEPLVSVAAIGLGTTIDAALKNEAESTKPNKHSKTTCRRPRLAVDLRRNLPLAE